MRRLASRARVPVRARYRVALVKLDRLGDFVLALSAIRLLLAYYGEKDCLLVISPAAEPLACREFPHTPRLLLPASLGHGRTLIAAAKYRRQLSSYAFERVICLRHHRWDYDEVVLAWMSAREHVRIEDGFTQRARPEWRTFAFREPGGIEWRSQTRASDVSDWDGSRERLCDELAKHHCLVEIATGRKVAVHEVLPSLDAASVRYHGGIVVTPMGSEAIRDIPLDLLRDGLRAIRQRCTSVVYLTGTPEQASALDQLAAYLQARGLDGLVCRSDLNFNDYLNLVGGARLVLTADTATAHLATALDRPAIVLLGGGHFGQFGPWHRSPRQVWLFNPVDCYHCDWRCVHPEPICLTKIPSERIREAVGRLLASS